MSNLHQFSEFKTPKHFLKTIITTIPFEDRFSKAPKSSLHILLNWKLPKKKKLTHWKQKKNKHYVVQIIKDWTVLIASFFDKVHGLTYCTLPVELEEINVWYQ